MDHPKETALRKLPLLSVKELSIDFVNDSVHLPVVRGVSFEVHPGEILAIVGESGCGKSASCLSLTGLLPSPPAFPRAESVLFRTENGEEDLFRIPERRLRRIRGGKIAYVFQEPAASLNPVFRVGDQIAEVLSLHRPECPDFRAEVVELLRRVGIPAPEQRANAYPHELSGGMQQRVMIAMALAGEPELLIADEPTTALDVTIQAQILDLIDNLRRERGMAVILITHNLGIVARLADRVAVMYAGSVVETGSAEAVIRHPRHPYTKALLAAVPRFGGKGTQLMTIPGSVPPPEKFDPGCRFCTRCGRRTQLSPAQQERCRTEVPPESFSPCGSRCFCFAPEEEG